MLATPILQTPSILFISRVLRFANKIRSIFVPFVLFVYFSSCFARFYSISFCATLCLCLPLSLCIAAWFITSCFLRLLSSKPMLHEAILLATCNATFVALQVAIKNSRVTPHFATAIVALRVARKVERPSTFRNVAR